MLAKVNVNGEDRVAIIFDKSVNLFELLETRQNLLEMFSLMNVSELPQECSYALCMILEQLNMPVEQAVQAMKMYWDASTPQQVSVNM